MKIRRFVAKDMRTALEQIKLELGVDAVIMSNKKIPEGVELMAAVDYNQQPSDSALQQPQAQPQDSHEFRDVENDVVSIANAHSENVNTSTQAPADSLSALMQRNIQASQKAPESHSKPLPKSDIEKQLKNFTDRLEQGNNFSAEQIAPEEQVTEFHNKPEPKQPVRQPRPETVKTTISPANDEVEKMRQEMASIRQLLEHQISGLMWQDMAQKDPFKALMVNRLLNLGLNEQVADQIASSLPMNNNEQEAWEEAKQRLTQQLSTTNNEIIHRGGVVSLVGPTGVGKTTTIAKLAARFAQIHGADQVALISTDSYRIAGFEQLSTYGKIIGCQVKLAKDKQTLDSYLQQFSNKKLILIDTAGMGQRDMRLSEHLTTLIANSRVRIRNYLVLAANTQQRVMQENVERFKKVPLAGCIFTKLDESLSVGEIIATSIQNGLPIGYLTDGQRVPEDIKVANTEKLVTLADRLATKVNGQNNWRPMPANYAVGM